MKLVEVSMSPSIRAHLINAETVDVGTGSYLSGLPTYRDLGIAHIF
jgi:hypothetical protein